MYASVRGGKTWREGEGELRSPYASVGSLFVVAVCLLHGSVVRLYIYIEDMLLEVR